MLRVANELLIVKHFFQRAEKSDPKLALDSILEVGHQQRAELAALVDLS